VIEQEQNRFHCLAQRRRAWPVVVAIPLLVQQRSGKHLLSVPSTNTPHTHNTTAMSETKLHVKVVVIGLVNLGNSTATGD
jgi:hypothetical protein